MALKKAERINTMSNHQVIQELKEKSLPVYGTNQEKRNRLKKHLNLPVDPKGGPAKKNTRLAIQK